MWSVRSLCDVQINMSAKQVRFRSGSSEKKFGLQYKFGFSEGKKKLLGISHPPMGHHGEPMCLYPSPNCRSTWSRCGSSAPAPTHTHTWSHPRHMGVITHIDTNYHGNMGIEYAAGFLLSFIDTVKTAFLWWYLFLVSLFPWLQVENHEKSLWVLLSRSLSTKLGGWMTIPSPDSKSVVLILSFICLQLNLRIHLHKTLRCPRREDPLHCLKLKLLSYFLGLVLPHLSAQPFLCHLCPRPR